MFKGKFSTISNVMMVIGNDFQDLISKCFSQRFEKVYFLKIGPNFEPYFKRYQITLQKLLLLGENILNFIYPSLELHNRYCHTLDIKEGQSKRHMGSKARLNCSGR